ncbi:MAG: TetR/AcrR family transcriptional regulator [Bacillota bacterium]
MSKSEKTRQKILGAALKLFSAKSFNGTTTKEIAAAAGVAEGTIFRYFNTKKDILISLAGPIVIESLNDFLQQLTGADDETFLRALLKNRLQLITENMELVKVVFYESQFHPEIRDRFVKDILQKAAGMLEQYLNMKIAAGDYRAVNPQVAVRSLAGMLGIFIAWRGYLHGDKFIKFDDDEVIEEIVKIFLYGVKNQQEEGAKSCADGILPALLLL